MNHDFSLLTRHPDQEKFWAEAEELRRYFYVLARKVSGLTHRERTNQNQLAKYESYNFKDNERREMYREDLVTECILSYIESRSKGHSGDKSRFYAINGAYNLWHVITDKYKLIEIPLAEGFHVEETHNEVLEGLKDQIVANLSREEKRMLDAFLNNEHKNGKPDWSGMDREMGFSLNNQKSKVAMESLRPKMMEAFFA